MIFLTGATGFLGAHVLCELLLMEENVRLLRRPSSTLTELENIIQFKLNKSLSDYNSHIEWIEGDIRDLDTLDRALKGVKLVIHCAATVSFSKKEVERMNQINVEGTANIVNACILNKVDKLVHVSSTSALSSFNNGRDIDESCDYTREEKNSRYGISKYLAEMEVWRGIEEGLDAAILNPSIILGYGNWEKGSCKLFQQYANGFPFYSTGSNAFVGVDDVSKLIVLLSKSNVSGERFLCLSENLPFREVFNMICDQFNVKRPRIKINKTRASITWRVFTVINSFRKSPLITKESAKASVAQIRFSNEKISQTFDFQFEPIESVVKKSASAYQKS
jgi:dihydroflavonol-4-reductase